MSEKCPQCERTDGAVRARQAYEGAPPALEVAPPPPPTAAQAVTPAAERPSWTRPGPVRTAVIGGYLAVLALVLGIALASGVDLKAMLLSLPVPGIGFWALLRWFLADRSSPPGPNPETVSAHKVIWTRRMQVWEHAWYCRDCRVAFWPAGVLGAEFPASPAVQPHDFPLMVATMAERAYGTAQPAQAR